MLSTISATIQTDRDYAPRVGQLALYRRVLKGTLYDNMLYEFHQERTGNGEYVPLRSRKPCVKYNLCKLVVQDSVALLFSEGRFPTLDMGDERSRTVLTALVAESRLNQAMLDAALRGSVGSVVVHMRVLKGRVFWDVMDTDYLTPEYDPEAPDVLVRMCERRKVLGVTLRGMGYTIADDLSQAPFWFTREWNATAEVWFLPQLVSLIDPPAPTIDAKRSRAHDLGFVPMVWLRNLPGGDALDGECTFAAAIETSIEIDYQLSQAGRGLKYQSDPLLMVREPAAAEDDFVRSASNALIVSEKGDAKLLEISGSAANAVVEYVRFLREVALESIHGNRSSADRIAAAQSGRALEMMNQALIWMADQLRVSYGVEGVLPLIRMVARVSRKMPLQVSGVAVRDLDDTGLQLRWPTWFAPTHQDTAALAQTLHTMRRAGVVSRQTAVRLADGFTGVPDVDDEIDAILADEQASRMDAASLPAAQSRVTEQLPT